MRVFRKLATRLLSTAVRYSSPESRGWGEAMLGELDFVEGDWDALRWTAGSLTALLRHSAPRQLDSLLERTVGSAGTPRPTRKKALEVVLGVGLAATVLGLLVCVLWRRLLVLLPPANWQNATVAVIAGVEIAYVRGALALWRQRRLMAMGILLAGVALTAHVALHAHSSCHGSNVCCEHNRVIR
jgi:hypothetical protein